MDESIPPPSPPVDSAVVVSPRCPSTSERRLRDPRALVGVAVAAGTVAGTVVGTSVGWWTNESAMAECARNPEDWCELGAAIGAIMFGLIAGAIAYLVTGLTVIFRCRPPGARTGSVLGHLAGLVAMAPVTMVLLTILV